jgi:hypothetical protein
VPKARGLLVIPCVVAALFAGSAASAAPATDPASPSVVPTTFIESLAAVPEAMSALVTARQALHDAVARQMSVRSAAAAADQDYAAATSYAHEVGATYTRADLAAAGTRHSAESTARAMYMNGGTAPSLFEVLLTADSQFGLTRSLEERQYLSAVEDRNALMDDQARAARAQAASATTEAISQRAVAGQVAAIAEASMSAVGAEVTAAQSVVDASRQRLQALMRATRVDRSSEYGRIRRCGDPLTLLLSRSGFAGEDLREAWAVVMRESGGRADAVSETGDLGLFQINTETWRDEAWFDRRLLLKRKYNAQIALMLSRGGRTWYSWGLDGHGRPNPGAYVKAGWTDERISSHIVQPYISWYAQYPCRPSYEKVTS